MKESTMAETFELCFQKLERAVRQLEDGTLSLEESLSAFEAGVHWSRKCHHFLEKAEKRIEIILKQEKGDPIQTSFSLEGPP